MNNLHPLQRALLQAIKDKNFGQIMIKIQNGLPMAIQIVEPVKTLDKITISVHTTGTINSPGLEEGD